MELPLSQGLAQSPVDVDAMADFIAGLQKPNGEIPWSAGGKTDPWDHVESAMGLSVAGRIREAERAYRWMAIDATARRELVVGDPGRRSGGQDPRQQRLLLHRRRGLPSFPDHAANSRFLRRLWPTLEAGIDYAVGLQADTGEIHWAKNGEGVVDRMALLTGSSSVYMSLKCALAVAALLGKRRSDWEVGQAEARRGDPPSSQPVQHDEGALFDGLVLSRSLRRRDRRRCPQADRPLLGEVRRPRMGGAVRLRSALGHDRGGLRTGPDAGGDRGIRAGGHRLQLDLRQEIRRRFLLDGGDLSRRRDLAGGEDLLDGGGRSAGP